MESEKDKIARILQSLQPGASQFFHTGPLGTGDPMLLKKGTPSPPTLLDNIDKPQIAKSILDPSLIEKKKYSSLSNYLDGL